MKPLLRPLLAALALAALPAPAPAQNADQTLAAALSGDWNDDGVSDAVLIWMDAEGVSELSVYEGDGYSGLHPVVTLRDVLWTGTMAGQFPQLEARSDTAFVVTTEQSAIGRTPWSQRMTVAYREGEYRVIGFDYEFYDRLDPDHSGSCSVNLATGAYTFRLGPGDGAPEEQRSGNGEDRAFPLAALTLAYFPAACVGLMN